MSDDFQTVYVEPPVAPSFAAVAEKPQPVFDLARLSEGPNQMGPGMHKNPPAAQNAQLVAELK